MPIRIIEINQHHGGNSKPDEGIMIVKNGVFALTAKLSDRHFFSRSMNKIDQPGRAFYGMSFFKYFDKFASLFALTLAVVNPVNSFGQDEKRQRAQVKQADECQLPHLRDELAERVERDQEARKALIEQRQANGGKFVIDRELHTKLMKIDAENSKWLQKQVEEHGWLSKTLVGEQGAQDAWLLVQHADQNRRFQRMCLDLMLEMPEGEVAPKNIAYLTDRVLVAEGKPQRYGTQISMEDGEPSVGDVEDPNNLDKRRADVGLGPIDEYIERIKKVYSPANSMPDRKSENKDQSDRD